MTKMNPEVSEEVNIATPNENTSNQDLNTILSRLDNLETENKSLKDQVEKRNPIADGKKFYEWPRHYSFKLWSWMPVLDYKSKKKDSSRDYVYKNQYGEYVQNQILELTLLKIDGKTKTENVIITEFWDGFTRSDKMECKVESNGSSPTGYVFDTKEFWEFTVDPKVIN